MPHPSPMRQMTRNLLIGLFGLFSREFSRRGVPILGYHSVGHVHSHINILPALFSVQMKELQSLGFRGVSFKTFVDLIEAGDGLPRDVVVLTFDDGLKNFRDNAWPILAECGFGATNFVPTDYVGGTASWYASSGLDPLPTLDWDELRDLKQAGCDIQSHGCSHRRLRELTPDDLAEEAARSKALLEEHLGNGVDLYGYPFGGVSVEYADALRATGYRAAVTVKQGLYRRGNNPFRIKRQILDYITIADEPTARLSIRACLNGGFARYVRTRNAFKCLRRKRSSES